MTGWLAAMYVSLFANLTTGAREAFRPIAVQPAENRRQLSGGRNLKSRPHQQHVEATDNLPPVCST